MASRGYSYGLDLRTASRCHAFLSLITQLWPNNVSPMKGHAPTDRPANRIDTK